MIRMAFCPTCKCHQILFLSPKHSWTMCTGCWGVGVRVGQVAYLYDPDLDPKHREEPGRRGLPRLERRPR
jgi:hypothetical protein